ncbi:MAG: BPSS1780 family membrane protein [Sedimenticola sp.]
MEPLFKVRYTGRLLAGAGREQVVTAFSRRFSIPAEKVWSLMASGKAVTLKKGLSLEKAKRYRDAVEELLMEVELVPMESSSSTAAGSGNGNGLAERLQQAADGLSLEPIDEPESGETGGISGGNGAARAAACPKCGSDAIHEGSCQACGIIIAKHLSMQAHNAESDSGADNHGSQANPYAVPQSGLIPEAEMGDFREPVPRPVGQGWKWLSRGYWHFRQNPFAWIGAILVWMIASIVLSAIPVIGAIGSIALSLLSPVIVAGFILGAQAQEQGEDFRVAHLLAGFSCNVKQLLLVGLLYIVGMVVIIIAMASMMGGLFMLNAEAVNQGAAPAAGTIVVAILAAMAIIIPLMMAYWFAPALIALEDMSAIAAMKLSFIGCVRNILPFLLYGVITLIFFIIGAIPAGLGLLVVIPVVSASIYTSYRDIYYC